MLKALQKVKRAENGCWEWQGEINPHGYGRLQRDGKRYYAHRFFYLKLVGLVPDGHELDHLCRNRSCVNPEHLEAVLPRVNKERGMSPAAVYARRSACKKGHEYKPDNTYLRHQGEATISRICKVCRRDDMRERRWKAGAQPYTKTMEHYRSIH